MKKLFKASLVNFVFRGILVILLFKKNGKTKKLLDTGLNFFLFLKIIKLFCCVKKVRILIYP